MHLWKRFQGTEITAETAAQLLQHGLLAAPLDIGGTPKRLCLTGAGTLQALDVPTAGAPRGGKPKRPHTRGILGKGGASAEPLGACPRCGRPVLEQVKSCSCSGWRSGCGFVIWKTMSGKRISTAMATKLLKRGRTQVLKGFVSKDGKRFDARLRVDEDKVAFEF